MDSLSHKIKECALSYGFTAAGITGPSLMIDAGGKLDRWIIEGRQGQMDWMANRAAERADPRAFFPDAESVLVVAMNYYRDDEKFILPDGLGTMSIYARGRDYHKVMRKKLSRLLKDIQKLEPETQGRVFVDSFPLMEKPLAVRAGIGWIGKNTLLLIKGKGSYFFLGGILLNLPLHQDVPLADEYCGSCNRCQSACPTQALSPFRIDSRRCISYLTIEHDGKIDPGLQKKMGGYIFGCDICQMVCPWNHFAQDTGEDDFRSRFKETQLDLDNLSGLSQDEFKRMFEGTPVRRTGYQNFIRNVKIAGRNREK